MAFAHLHVHSQFSLLDGAVPVGELPRAAAELGQQAVALTDNCNLYGAVAFDKACKAAGVRPVFGAGLWVEPRGLAHPTPPRGGYHLVLLVEDQLGYRNLCRLITTAIFDGTRHKPRVDLALLRRHREGLVALSSGMRGPARGPLLAGDPATARQRLAELAELFGPEHLYVELQDTGRAGEQELNEGCRRLAAELGLATVVTNDVHYLGARDAPVLDVLHSIAAGGSLNQPDLPTPGTDQLYLKSETEMRALFPDDAAAVERTAEIAERCRFRFGYGTYHFPASNPPEPGVDTDGNWAFFFRAFPPPRDFGLPGPGEPAPPRPEGAGTLEGYFRWYASTGLELRLRRVPVERHGVYRERLEEELGIIASMDFPAYFLIVAEFINWAKDHGIPVGPGRGSAAGSVVAWGMRITDIDPVRFDLLFERFLNPERVSMPDIDIDFCQDRREEVIEHTRRKYGSEYVAQIITYGKFQAKLAVRDVARVCDLGFDDADRIARLIPDELGIKLDAAVKEEALSKLVGGAPEVRRVVGLARHIEGLARQTGVHAAGVVVSDLPLVDLCPLYRDGPDGGPVVQFDMKSAEAIGLIKFDFLGLKTLDEIRDAVRMVERNTGQRIDMTDLPEDDPATFELLSRGDTVGVFQLESSGMRELLVRLRPRCLDDLVPLVALYRPGPLQSGMVEEFVERRHGRREVTWPLPQLRPVLESTYGVVLYQEQVMQVARVLAGYSLGEADILRRAMGKKQASEMERQKSRFLEGAASRGVDPVRAEEIFELLAKFAAYGFNKSHSAAYGFVAFQTAWLKANHRAEYMASLMSVESGNTDKVLACVADCRRAGLRILPPDLNLSTGGFDVRPEDRGAIRFGLAAVKNVGAASVEAILEAREAAGGRFSDLMDCLERLDYGRVNRRVLENLVKCGAFDWTGFGRASLAGGLDSAIAAAQRRQADLASGQGSLFGAPGAGVPAPGFRLPELPEWPVSRRLDFEKEAVGFYLTGHPLESWRGEVARFATCSIGELERCADGREVTVAGVAAAVRQSRTRRGDRMGFVTMEDQHGAVECVFFAEPWAASARAVRSGQPVLVAGKVEHGAEGVKLLASSAELLSDLRERRTRVVHLTVGIDELDGDRLGALAGLLEELPGSCRTLLHLLDHGCKDVVLELPEPVRVGPGERLQEGLAALFGRDGVASYA